MHISIALEFHRFLHSKFQGQIFQFAVVAFGLCSAPIIFTQLRWCISLFSCKNGIRIIFYIDVTIIMALSRDLAFKHCDFLVNLLQHPGVLLNFEKSDLTLMDHITFLGLIWNTSVWKVELMQEKVECLRCMHPLGVWASLIQGGPKIFYPYKFHSLCCTQDMLILYVVHYRHASKLYTNLLCTLSGLVPCSGCADGVAILGPVLPVCQISPAPPCHPSPSSWMHPLQMGGTLGAPNAFPGNRIQSTLGISVGLSSR